MKKIILPAAILFGITASLSALAAEEITPQEVKDKGYTKIATIHTTAKATSPMDVKTILSKRADEKGGSYYVIIAGRQHGRYSATADVYK